MDETYQSDPAGYAAAYLSIAAQLTRYQRDELVMKLQGGDALMRAIMQVAMAWEDWACRNVDFAALEDVWVYLVEDKLGAALNQAGGLPAMLVEDDMAENHAAFSRAAVEMGCVLVQGGK